MLFGKEEEYIELEHEGEEKKAGRIPIQVEQLNEYADSDRIQKKLRDGNILLVKIKPLKDKDLNELKRAVARIRRTCEAMNGDIAAAGDDWIIITPPVARITRMGE
jgi:hypothetical protein